MTTRAAARDDTTLATLANGVRVLTVVLPWLDTAAVSVFVRSGSRNEPRTLAGISHFVEHMAFKGTAARDCQRINLDAERLGADVNAHTDKDHTAFHMRGLARDAEQFVAMLGDIVQHPTFPAHELERERQVLLEELAEEQDDALATAFKLFDAACFGAHGLAQPVIGHRASILRIGRDDLLGYVRQQYSGANVVVAVAGNVEPAAIERAAADAFGALPAGAPNALAPPAWLGGVKARAQPGSGQTHVVLGFPLPPLTDDAHHAAQFAAALFGEGMSSPLLDEVRERRGLVYYAACSADLGDLAGQFVVEASMAPRHVDEFVATVARLLAAHASSAADPVQLQRARNQLAVRSLQTHEQPSRRVEAAALELFAHGRVRPRAEWLQRIEAIDAAAVRDAFARMLHSPAAVGLAGKVLKDTRDRCASGLAALAR